MEEKEIAEKLFHLRTKSLGCCKCELSQTRKNILLGMGKAPADIMIIVDSPTLEEDTAGKYCVGDKWMVLRDIFIKSEINKLRLYLTGLVKCTTQTVGDEHKLLKSEITSCSEYLNDELDFTRPKLIISMGDHISKFLVGNRSLKVGSSHGGLFFSERYKCNIMPTFDLNTVIKNPSLKDLLVFDFKKAVDLVESRVTSGINIAHTVLNTDSEITTVLDSIQQNYDSFAYDIETNGVADSAQLVCITFSPEVGKSFLIPILDEHSQPVPIDWKNHLNRLFGMGKVSIAHNGKFDSKILKHYGVNVGNLGFDTMLAHALMDENASHKLKDLSVVYTDLGHYSDELEQYKLQNKIAYNYRELPNRILYPYALKDSDCTYRLYVLFARKLKEIGVDKLFNKIVMPLQNVLMETEYRGALVDTCLLKQMEDDYSKNLKTVEEKIFTAVGTPFNIASVKQLREVLFTKLKLTPITHTKTGPSTDVATLKKLSNISPVAKDIVRYRELDKIISTYLIGLTNEATNGTIHTQYNIGLTRSGRLSSSRPNLQNIPKEVMDVFIPRAGYTFVYGDYSQMEFKLLGHYSEDPKMIHSINKGDDVHKFMASTIWGVPIDRVTPEQRTKAKTCVYSVLYGAGSNNVAEQLGITPMDAKNLIDTFYKTFPSIKSWMKRTVEFARRNEYVANSFGRRRHLPHINSKDDDLRSEAERVAVNTIVQGLSADIVNFGVSRVEPLVQKFGGYLTFHVHDSLTYEIPDEYTMEALSAIKMELERPIKGIKVLLTVDMKYGKRWGSLQTCTQP